ncbi:MAG: hypothetical protein HN919_16065 [Verrucomicrobia bacterium]|nr:hypothetical protein [Verrucomicrobiota bacterium]MBT7067815.1 hypothetical protein [Verrucomicrobiota bacterium]
MKSTPDSLHSDATRPASVGYRLSMVPGLLGSAWLIAWTWAWNQRYELRTGYDKTSDLLVAVPTPRLWIIVMAALGLAGLLWLVARHWPIDTRARTLRRCRVVLTVFALLSLPFGLLSRTLAPDGLGLGMLWHIGLPVVALAALVALVALLLPLLEGRRGTVPSGRHRYRLWIFFFIAVHLPSLWFARPWESDRFYRHRHLGGDEPRYLLMTHSLAQDRDFNLLNNYVENHRDRYICWTNPYNDPGDAAYASRAVKWGADAPHSTPEYWQGRRYGIERLGMPLLIAPAYKIGLKCGQRQRYGVVLMLNLVLVFSMANIYLFAAQLGVAHGAALLAALGAGLSAPLCLYGVSAYTEPVSAALIIFCLRMIHAFRARRLEGGMPALLPLLSFAVGLAYLPWVHEKMIPLALFLGLCFILAARPRWRTLLPIALALALSFALQGRYYWLLYGQVTPAHVHGHSFSAAALFREGLWGLLLDQKRGVMPAAPWVLAGGVGLGIWFRRQWRFAVAPAVMVVAFLLMTGAFGGWYGGGSAQPRYLLNILPILAVGVAVAWAHGRRPLRGLILVTVLLGMAQGINAVLTPDFLVWHRAPFLRDLYPCVFKLDPVEWMTITAWMVALLWLGVGLPQWPRRKSLAVIPACCCLLIMGGSVWRFHKSTRPTIAVQNPALLSSFYRDDLRFATFNKRIMMRRWERAYSAQQTPDTVMGARTQYENKVSGHCSVVQDPTAEGGAAARWEGEAHSDWLPLTVGPILSLYEGDYRATFHLQVRGRAVEETQPLTVRLVVSAGGVIFNSTVLEPKSLTGDWADYQLPFTLATPVRGVDMSVQVVGGGTLQMDRVQLDYLVLP